MREPSDLLVPRTTHRTDAPPVGHDGIDPRTDPKVVKARRRADSIRKNVDWYWIDDDDPSIVPWGYFEDDDL